MSKNLLPVLLLLVSLSACGFQLRGATQLPAQLQPLNLQEGGDGELRNELLALLEANDVALAASPALAAGHLKIGNQVQTRRVISVDSRGRAREYELNYSVYYTIKSAHIDAENVVKLQRELLFDPDNVLGADYEEQTLYRDMKRDAARLILQQLESTRPLSMPIKSLKPQPAPAPEATPAKK
jgi:LPS-assembly lipoprotein